MSSSSRRSGRESSSRRESGEKKKSKSRSTTSGSSSKRISDSSLHKSSRESSRRMNESSSSGIAKPPKVSKRSKSVSDAKRRSKIEKSGDEADAPKSRSSEKRRMRKTKSTISQSDRTPLPVQRRVSEQITDGQIKELLELEKPPIVASSSDPSLNMSSSSKKMDTSSSSKPDSSSRRKTDPSSSKRSKRKDSSQRESTSATKRESKGRKEDGTKRKSKPSSSKLRRSKSETSLPPPLIAAPDSEIITTNDTKEEKKRDKPRKATSKSKKSPTRKSSRHNKSKTIEEEELPPQRNTSPAPPETSGYEPKTLQDFHAEKKIEDEDVTERRRNTSPEKKLTGKTYDQLADSLGPTGKSNHQLGGSFSSMFSGNSAQLIDNPFALLPSLDDLPKEGKDGDDNTGGTQPLEDVSGHGIDEHVESDTNESPDGSEAGDDFNAEEWPIAEWKDFSNQLGAPHPTTVTRSQSCALPISSLEKPKAIDNDAFRRSEGAATLNKDADVAVGKRQTGKKVWFVEKPVIHPEKREVSREWYTKDCLAKLLNHEVAIATRGSHKNMHRCMRGFEHLQTKVDKGTKIREHIMYVKKQEEALRAREKSAKAEGTEFDLAEELRKCSAIKSKDDRKAAYKLAKQDAKFVKHEEQMDKSTGEANVSKIMPQSFTSSVLTSLAPSSVLNTLNPMPVTTLAVSNHVIPLVHEEANRAQRMVTGTTKMVSGAVVGATTGTTKLVSGAVVTTANTTSKVVMGAALLPVHTTMKAVSLFKNGLGGGSNRDHHKSSSHNNRNMTHESST